MNKLKRGDVVKIIAGKYKNQTGIIKKILINDNRVIIDKLTVSKRHTKPNNIHPDGGIINVESSIHISNVNYLVSSKNSKTLKASRIGISLKNDKKTRFLKKTKKEIS